MIARNRRPAATLGRRRANSDVPTRPTEQRHRIEFEDDRLHRQPGDEPVKWSSRSPQVMTIVGDRLGGRSVDADSCQPDDADGGGDEPEILNQPIGSGVAIPRVPHHGRYLPFSSHLKRAAYDRRGRSTNFDENREKRENVAGFADSGRISGQSGVLRVVENVAWLLLSRIRENSVLAVPEFYEFGYRAAGERSTGRRRQLRRSARLAGQLLLATAETNA